MYAFKNSASAISKSIVSELFDHLNINNHALQGNIST